MIQPEAYFVGPNHLREVYSQPVPVDCEWGRLVTCELIVDCAYDALYVRNRVTLDLVCDPWRWPPE